MNYLPEDTVPGAAATFRCGCGGGSSDARPAPLLPFGPAQPVSVRQTCVLADEWGVTTFKAAYHVPSPSLLPASSSSSSPSEGSLGGRVLAERRVPLGPAVALPPAVAC